MALEDEFRFNCYRCAAELAVPARRKGARMVCPACGRRIRAQKHESFAVIKRLLRRLLYPSFQDWF